MSGTSAAVAFAAALVAGGFAASVLAQWWRRRRPHQLAWTLGLGLFACAIAAEGFAELGTWSDLPYRVFYFAAAANVAFLGLGSVYLLSSRVGRAWEVYVVGGALLFLFLVASASLNSGAFAYSSPACALGTTVSGPQAVPIECRSIGGLAMPSYVRVVFLLLNIPGALALIGVAVYSFWRSRLTFNLLIAAGGGVLSLGGAMARLGNPSLIVATSLAGIALMYLGFLKASGLPKTAPAAEPAKAG